MKVLQVINCFARSGGAEKFVFDLTLALKTRQIDVEVLSLIPSSAENKEFVEKVTEYGVKVYILSDKGVYNLYHIKELHDFFKKHKYDAVHVHLFPSLYFLAIAKKQGMNLFYTEHNTDNRRRHYFLFQLLDKWIYKKYDKIVCISSHVENALLQHIGKFSTTVIPNGICLSDFYNAVPLPRQELVKENENVCIVTMCARFSKVKDYKTLFRALRLLPQFVHVICVGDGELKAENEQYCEQQGLMDRVHFLGLRNDVNQIFKASDIIVLSSEHEGFSISMLEAMASGKPFVASEVPGIADLVKEHALLFPYKNEHVLAKCILKLWQDKVYRNCMIGKSQEFASRYDILSSADKYIELYQR